ELRQQCCETLARLGPVAVAALEDTLKKSRNPRYQQVAIKTLKQMGPIARKATPTLARFANSDYQTVREEAQEALRFVTIPDDRVCVNDVGGVLAYQSRKQLDQRIQALCQKHHFQFFAETVRTLPDDRAYRLPVSEKARRQEAVARWAEVRRRQVGAENGVYLLICEDPPAVHVAFGPDVKAKAPSRLSEQSLRGVLRTHLHNKEKGLEKAVELVADELSHSP